MVTCRSCISDCEEYVKIHEERAINDEVTTLANLLNFCTNLDFPVEEEDLPTQICMNCLKSLADSYAFKKIVLQANQLLRIPPGNALDGDENKGEASDDIGTGDDYKEMKQFNDLQFSSEFAADLEERPTEGKQVRDLGCTENDEESYEEEYLEEHVKETEQNDKPLADPITPNTCYCGKTFLSRANFRRHLRIHSGELAFECELCHKSFSQAWTLQRHTAVHTGEKPHTCSICGKGFRYSNNMVEHVRSHTGETPFECVVCGKRLSSSSRLGRHMMVHSGIRPFKCKLCDKVYRQKTSLKNHMLIHG